MALVVFRSMETAKHVLGPGQPEYISFCWRNGSHGALGGDGIELVVEIDGIRIVRVVDTCQKGR